MDIVITGSSGFVGRAVCGFLAGRGHSVTGIDRVPAPGGVAEVPVSFISADTTVPGPWQEAVEAADAVVNLAGVNIFRRWTKKYKRMIYDSRVLTTRNVVDAISPGKRRVLISTSAVGYYGDRGDEILDETKGAGSDFLARVCMDWEKEALSAAKKGARAVCTRFGVVMGRGGGALSQMIPVYRMFAGGPLGSGRQWFPWIHLEDLARGIDFLIGKDDIEGVVNLCSPNPVRNLEFAKTLGDVLGRPAFVRVPALALRLVAGEFGSLVLNSQRAIPSRLLSFGFSFSFPDLKDALLEAASG